MTYRRKQEDRRRERKRNPYARELADPRYRQRRVVGRTDRAYKRNPIPYEEDTCED
jgi:hypothetical protein